jgi:hypothetical protein
MEEARMSHDANPPGREPAEGYAGAGSPWAAPPEPDEPGAAEPGGPARARASVPQARGSASVQPPQRPTPPGEHGGWPAQQDEHGGWPAQQDEHGGWPAPHEEQGRPGPFPPAGPPPAQYSTPPAQYSTPPAQYSTPPVPPVPSGPHSGSASVPPRPTGSAQVPGSPSGGHAQVPPAAGHAQVPPAAGSFPGFGQPVSPPAGQPPVNESLGGYGPPPVNQSLGGYGRPAGTASVPEYGQPPQPYGQPPQPYGSEYGQPTSVYGAPAGAYPGQAATAYQPGQPTNVYGTPSGPPAMGYDDATAQVSGQPGTFPPAPQRKNKRLLLVLALVAAVVVLAGIGTAVTLALGGSSTNFAVNDCVKESSGKAVKASCSDSKAYKVINKVGKNTDCADQNQPYVVVEHKGSKDEVLCLRPASQK